jgi:predicted nucleic acid-binding protein
MEPMKPTVYIETSVISYYAARLSRDLIVAAHQQITQEWWDKVLPTLRPFISQLVLDELKAEPSPVNEVGLAAVRGFAILPMPQDMRDRASRFREKMQIPEDRAHLTVHLAIAAGHGMDYLVTWDRVLRFASVQGAGRGAGSGELQGPTVCSPFQLGGDKLAPDPIVEEVRRARREIEARYPGTDAYYRHLMRVQKKLGKRLVRGIRGRAPTGKAPAKKT